MKTDDLLLYGGGAVLLYLLFIKPKQVAPGVTQVAPVTSMLPVAQPNASTAILSALTALAPVAIKYLTPSPQQSAALPVAEIAANQSIQTPALPIDLPGLTNNTAPVYAYQPITTDSYQQMFENGDYPGAEMSGLVNYQAGRIGLY